MSAGTQQARAAGWFDPDDDRTARAVWSRLAEPGDHEATAFVARLGPAAALGAVLRGGPGALPRWRVRLPVTDPARDLQTLRRFDGRVVVPGDDEWPCGLDALGGRRPFCLWVRGPLRLDVAASRAVAVVGARAASPYGERVAADLAAGCADRGLPVVSGAAYGIDAAAHRGALAVGGPTVGVLACGVERPYPRGNAALIDRMAAEGALVSEVPPGSSPTRWRFVERNRLIAALSEATVVVEAGLRSGASITAGEATELGRPVGAVPGPVTSPSSAGCHRLLRLGATCVTTAAEVAELVTPWGDQGALDVLPAGGPRAAHDDLGPGDARVHDALPLSRGVPLEALVRTAGLEPAVVTAALGRLEVLGLAARDGGGWRRARSAGGAGPVRSA